MKNSQLWFTIISLFESLVLAQRNLVTNGAFADGTLTGWNCGGPSNNASLCGVLKAATGQPGYISFITQGFSLSQSTIAGNNIPYLLQYDTYCADMNNVTAYDCVFPLQVQLGDASWADTTTVFITPKSKVLTPSGAGSTLSFSTPANVSETGWQLYINNITLYPLSNGQAFESNSNLLQNGGFENSTSTSGPNDGWGCSPSVSSGCCMVSTVGRDDLYAEDGMNYAELYPGCQLIQTPNTQTGKSYDLSFYGYCIANGTGCGADNIVVNIGNSSTPTTFSLAQGDLWTGPYLQFSHTFTAKGSDTITLSSHSAVRLDNFTVFPSTSKGSGGGSGSGGNSNGGGGGSSSNIGPIVGGAVGGVAVVAAIVTGFLYWKRRRDNNNSENKPLTSNNNQSFSGEKHWEPSSMTMTPPIPTSTPGHTSTSSPPPPSMVSHYAVQPNIIQHHAVPSSHTGGISPIEPPRQSFVPEIQSEDHTNPDTYPSFHTYRE